MTTNAKPAWQKFLKLKTEVPISLADGTQTGKKRKRQESNATTPFSKRPAMSKAKSKGVQSNSTKESSGEKTTKLNRQKKKAAQKTKRSKKEKADSNASRLAALEYLSLYSTAKQDWKFSKPRQNWVIKNLYDHDCLSDERFDQAIQYLCGIQGAVRDRILEEAKAVVEGDTEKEKEKVREETQEERDEDASLDSEKLSRAQQVVTALEVDGAGEAGLAKNSDCHSAGDSDGGSDSDSG